MPLVDRMPAPLTHAAYRAQQASLHYPLKALQEALRRVANPDGRADRGQIDLVERRYVDLLKADVTHVDEGLYPAHLLFQLPMRDYARTVPKLLRDLPQVFMRYRRRDWQSLPDDAEPSRYPAYYRRTFHWQSDGYLSRRSAELYDLGVELVFLGSGDVMRRQVIPPIVRHLRSGATGGARRILDVACGTGRTLRQLAQTMPEHDYFGLDLSPYYLQMAQDVLRDRPFVSLVADNAEAMPFEDEAFDVVTSTFLFHELPRPARTRVLGEMRRVLKPGGLLVIEDSVQRSDAPDLAFFLERFPDELHEPFYRDYLAHGLEDAMTAMGLEEVQQTPAFMAKVITAKKRAA